MSFSTGSGSGSGSGNEATVSYPHIPLYIKGLGSMCAVIDTRLFLTLLPSAGGPESSSLHSSHSEAGLSGFVRGGIVPFSNFKPSSCTVAAQDSRVGALIDSLLCICRGFSFGSSLNPSMSNSWDLLSLCKGYDTDNISPIGDPLDSSLSFSSALGLFQPLSSGSAFTPWRYLLLTINPIYSARLDDVYDRLGMRFVCDGPLVFEVFFPQ